MAASALFAQSAGAASADIRVDVDKPTVSLSPYLYGLFYEDINYGADGGLYAELVQNRSFEYHPYEYKPHAASTKDALYAWEKIERKGARADIAVVDDQPLNANNTKYLEIKIAQSGEAGVSNSGFWGIPIDAGAKYDFSVFARRSADWDGAATLVISLELPDGTSAGSITLDGIGTQWAKHTGVITALKTADKAKLAVTTTGKGTLALDMISLFPQETWGGRKNGLRKDMVQAIKDLNPKFLRFPGGCIAHGLGIKNMYRWKDSVGPVEERKPNFNLWGYYQTYGLGYYEYFLLCEDLGMTPLPVVPVGVSCGFRGLEAVPMDQLQPHIQDVLDLIEFSNGPTTSEWGAVRAKMGHPAPFNMEYICLGNEEHNSPEFRERFPLFVEAVRAKHPEIKIIGTSGFGIKPAQYEMMAKLKVHSSDEHYYETPEWFIHNQNRFDTLDRSKPKIFVGEYASRGNRLINALGEAAYLTGVERNGDIVEMASYAPLFARTDIDVRTWRPDLIFFDNRQLMRTPNYYVQQLFGQNKGDVYLSNTHVLKDGFIPGPIAGAPGIGSWQAAIEVSEFTVNGRKLDLSQWKADRGNFKMQDGNCVQSDPREKPAMSLANENFSDKTITYTTRFRKTDGRGGFIIRFGADKRGRGGYWWNLGNADNTRHALECFGENSDRRIIVTQEPGSITEGWHDVKVVTTPDSIECSLDGKLIHAYKIPSVPLSVASTYDKTAGEIIIKLVNPSPEAIDANITLAGAKIVAKKGTLISLSGAKEAVNTIGEPEIVRPMTAEINVASEFKHLIPAMSVECIRIKGE